MLFPWGTTGTFARTDGAFKNGKIEDSVATFGDTATARRGYFAIRAAFNGADRFFGVAIRKTTDYTTSRHFYIFSI